MNAELRSHGQRVGRKREAGLMQSWTGRPLSAAIATRNYCLIRRGGLKTQIADHHLGNPAIRSEYKDSSI